MHSRSGVVTDWWLFNADSTQLLSTNLLITIGSRPSPSLLWVVGDDLSENPDFVVWLETSPFNSIAMSTAKEAGSFFHYYKFHILLLSSDGYLLQVSYLLDRIYNRKSLTGWILFSLFSVEFWTQNVSTFCHFYYKYFHSEFSEIVYSVKTFKRVSCLFC